MFKVLYIAQSFYGMMEASNTPSSVLDSEEGMARCILLCFSLMTPTKDILTFNRNCSVVPSSKECDQLQILLPSTRNGLIHAILVLQYQSPNAPNKIS